MKIIYTYKGRLPSNRRDSVGAKQLIDRIKLKMINKTANGIGCASL